MKIFSSSQTRKIDKYTTDNEPISSIDLMERAAINIVNKLIKEISNTNKLLVISGIGNNGGDGLAVSRLLLNNSYNVKTIFCNFSNKVSPDCNINLKRLKETKNCLLEEITDSKQLNINSEDIIIDCLFGSGLTRPVSGEFAEVINKINESNKYVISIDIPSGLFGEDNSFNTGSIIKADKTYTIQFPPISSLFEENHKYFGQLDIIDINLNTDIIQESTSAFNIIDSEDIKSFFKARDRFAHKGVFGHALLIAGSYSKAGAAVLASQSCLRSGVGRLSLHIPSKIYDILQISSPEAMIEIDNNERVFSGIDDFSQFSAIGIGPGIGIKAETASALVSFISENNSPLVIDADGLNILSEIQDFQRLLKTNTIISPHPKEFERLFGKFENSYARLEFMREFSKATGVVIILKGGYTCISLTNGEIWFNTIGNPGMATAGSGDVLTGIITSFLAQGYSVDQAALMGVYIHALAGDFACKEIGQTALIASDITANLSKAFLEFESTK